MNWKILILAVSIITGSTASAQHCVWDGNSFIMLDLETSDSVKVHRIYLLDSVGKLVVGNKYNGDRLIRDTARFWKNPGEKDSYRHGKKLQRFSFARDYYVLPFGRRFDAEPYQVIVLYSSGKNVYRKKFPVQLSHVHDLCTQNKELWKGELEPMHLVFK